jgi:RNA polymerase sigma-70 factor (ECF subfamily)
MTIASNLLRDQFRKRRGRVVVPIEEGNLVAHDDPSATLDATEAERRLMRGLSALPRLQREVFLLRAQQGMDYEEIARALETTPGSARVHYHNAVKRLKELVA